MADTGNIYDPSDSYPVLVKRCGRLLSETLSTRFQHAGYDITPEQWVLLIHLTEKDGISQQEIADRYGSSKVTTLKMLEKLEQKGMVIRKTCPNDARRNRVYITELGKTTRIDLDTYALENTDSIRSGISEEEITTMKNIMRKMIRNALSYTASEKE